MNLLGFSEYILVIEASCVHYSQIQFKLDTKNRIIKTVIPITAKTNLDENTPTFIMVQTIVLYQLAPD